MGRLWHTGGGGGGCSAIKKQTNLLGLFLFELFVTVAVVERAAKVVVKWCCWPHSNGTVINKRLKRGELKIRKEIVIVISIIIEFGA